MVADAAFEAVDIDNSGDLDKEGKLHHRFSRLK